MFELILFPIASFMVLFIAATVKWSSRMMERVGFSFVLFVLSMMAAMIGSVAVYFNSPSIVSVEFAASLNFSVMMAGIGAILYSFITFKGRTPAASGNDSNLWTSWWPLSVYRSAVIALVLLNEILMGWGFLLISGFGAAEIQSMAMSSFIRLLDVSVNSYWFTFTMSAEMVISLIYFRKQLPAVMKTIVTIQAVIMVLLPTALAPFNGIELGVYAGSVAMIVLFIYLFDALYKTRDLEIAVSNYIIRLLAVYVLMMAALVYWSAGGSLLPLSISLIVEMVLYFNAILNTDAFAQKNVKTWLKHPAWTFTLISLIFAGEYFMAALLDVEFYGIRFLSSLHTAAIGTAILPAILAALFDFIQYVGLITGSVWFYIMMGAEMGTLVIFQIKKVRQFETKVRLALVVIAYSIYSVLIPFFLFPQPGLSHIPFLGWSMGVGTSGAFAPALLIAIAGTYLISGMLSFLFGGRQVCSTFCTAALMYQGTFYDSMKEFNKSSPLARKIHKNMMSKLYVVTASIVWSSIFIVILLSYLTSIGVVHVSLYGVDPLAFAYVFYFNFLWYVIFISIPFVGTYGCVSTGICHWGMFNQFIGRLGFWRIKVRNPTECVTCKTKDCVSACPVGLTAMPGNFIEKGEFRSYKCIGVGECASACPVDNIFFYDARNWFRDRLKMWHSAKAQGSILKIREKGIENDERN
jgi:polyferredoxin